MYQDNWIIGMDFDLEGLRLVKGDYNGKYSVINIDVGDSIFEWDTGCSSGSLESFKHL